MIPFRRALRLLTGCFVTLLLHASILRADEPAPNLTEKLEAEGFAVFAKLLAASGLAEELAKAPPFTCFAPEDDAFGNEEVDKLLAKARAGELTETLKYHLVNGPMSEEILRISRREPTLNGKFIVIWVGKKGIKLNNDARLTRTDIACGGHVIHGVSKLARWDAPGALP